VNNVLRDEEGLRPYSDCPVDDKRSSPRTRPARAGAERSTTEGKDMQRTKTRLLTTLLLTLSLMATTASIALADVAVKVECWGDCQPIQLRHVCATVSSTALPTSVMCDDTAGAPSSNCRGVGAAAGCRGLGSMQPNHSLGSYCLDGPGYDAIVMCR